MILENKRDYKLMEMMFKPNVKPAGKHETFAQAMNNLYQTNRTVDDPFLLNIVQTGNVSSMAYGTAIRAVQMTRGNRQGNNAFQTVDNSQKAIYVQP